MNKSSWIKPLTYALILFIGPLLAYYLFYVQSREDALLDRSFSHLTNISARTEGRINNVFTVINNACPTKTIGFLVVEENVYNNLANALSKNDLGLEAQPSYSECWTIKSNKNRSVRSISRDQLEFTLGKVKVNANIQKLIGDLDTNNRFNDIFIFDENGNVIYQRYPENGRVQNLSELQDNSEKSDEQKKRLVNDPLEHLRISYRGRNYLMPSQPLQIAFKDFGTEVSDINSAQAAKPSKEYEKWLMAGLIDESQFNSQKLQFQPDTVAIVVFLISIIVLSGPFLKIWYLGRFESFKKLDVILLVASGFTLSSILTIFIIQLDARDGINDFMEARLKSISKFLASDIRDELVIAISELEQAETAMSGLFERANIKLQIKNQLDENKTEALNRAIVSGTAQDSETKQSEDKCFYLASSTPKAGDKYAPRDGDLLVGDRMDYRAQDYPYFTMAYLMDRDGCQIIKWTTLEHPTSPGQFGDRSYFLRPLANARIPSKLYTVDNSSQPTLKTASTGEQPADNKNEENILSSSHIPGQQKKFFMEFITSRTTGEKSIVLSIPVGNADVGEKSSSNNTSSVANNTARKRCLESTRTSPQPCVAVMSMSTLRAMQAVLPFGFGFAIVDRNGQILVHHEGNASTELNLVNELADGALLQSALFGNDTREFNTGYHGDIFHFLVEPLGIEGSGFSLVTFYSKNSVLMPYLESVGMTLITWLIWFSILFFIALTLWQWNKFVEGRLLSIISRKLRRLEVILLFGTAGALLLCFFYPTFSLIAPIYIVSVLLIWLFKVSINFRSQPEIVVVITWILVLSASSLPILGLFSLYKTEAFAGYLQLQIVDHNSQVETQRMQIRDWLSGRKTANDDIAYHYIQQGKFDDTNPYTNRWHRYPLFYLETNSAEAMDAGNSTDCFASAYTDNARENYKPSNNYVQLKPLPFPRDFNLWQFMLSHLPDYSDQTVQLHAMYRSPKLFDIKGEECSVKQVSQILASGQKFNFVSNISGLFVIGFLIILGVVLWYVLVRTLGLRTENYLRLLNFKLPAKNSGSRDLIYGLGEDSKLSFFSTVDQTRIQWLDLRALSIDEASNAVDRLLFEADENGNFEKDILILNHFEDCLIDREVVQARTLLLERLVRLKSLSIVMLLNVDPLSFITSTFDVKEEATLISRLASLLTQFSVSFYQEEPPTALSDCREDYILREECYHPNLRAIYQSIYEQSSQKNLDNNEIVQLVKSRANAIYQQMWNLCTHAEKIMLIELAHENLVNPNNWDVARLLKQRGYLRRDPFHRIFNESFKQFILQMEQLENTQAWRKESASTWSNIRLPLFVVAIGAIVFLAFTQPSFFNSVFAFAAAGTASLPFLVNLIMAKLKSGGDK